MPEPIPDQVSALWSTEDPGTRERAWAEFLGAYSRLLIRTARRASSDHDETMDRYAFILDQLRQDDFRRLRAYAADGRGKFTTWLVVVARRLCVDHHRSRFGRPQTPTAAEDDVERDARRRLARLIAHESDPDRLVDQRAPDPEARLVESEHHHLLEAAVAELGDADRLLLTLRFEDGLPVEQIARMIGAPSRFHVYRRLKAVLGVLRRNLVDRGLTGL